MLQVKLIKIHGWRG